MSNITLQFGQCGNQVGQALYSCVYEDIKSKNECCVSNKRLNNEYIKESQNMWFHVKQSGLEARSLLIDTEQKVIHQANNKPYKFKNVIAGSYGGSANNWAFGYTSRCLLVASDIMERLRHEIEKCDFITCLLNILSSSGGTGSGVGSRIIELMREEYPSKFITNIIVLPFQKGDIVTQNYNTLLTLSKLYDVTDNTILFENDKIYDITRKLTSDREVRLSDLNQLIAQQLASIAQPLNDVTFSQVVSRVTTHPSYNFIQIRSAPHLNVAHLNYELIPNWSILTNQVFKSSKTDVLVNPRLCKKIRYIGNVVVTRGYMTSNEIDLKRFKEKSMYVSWVPETERVLHYGQQRGILNYQRFISLLTNNNSILSGSWTDIEKQLLLETLQKYGVNNIQKIAEAVPSKSIFDIRSIISKYQCMAQRAMAETCSSTASSSSEAPVDIVLKYIALFDYRTDKQINLEDCYMVLSDLTKGDPSKQLEGKTAQFFHECFTKLARSVKEDDHSKKEVFLDSLEPANLSTTRTYRAKVDRNGILSDTNLNPCKVPANLLMDKK
ncbi:Tubulin/FtsZ family, GTPase domain [Popillia japonica]|uniref:Tubulin delta chain n=1 Tax=Popillia japonica TaxID=7064 RepID=A0AAW1MIM7_POPJA